MDLLECGGMTKGCPTARWRLIPIAVLVAASLSAQGRPQPPDWTAVEAEALEVYQTLIRFDTSATERIEAEYLKRLFDRHGIPAQVL
jgi:hypothetical protein